MFNFFFCDPIDFFCCCLTFLFYSLIVLSPALHISGRDIVSLSTRPASFYGDEEQIHSFVKGEMQLKDYCFYFILRHCLFRQGTLLHFVFIYLFSHSQNLIQHEQKLLIKL